MKANYKDKVLNVIITVIIFICIALCVTPILRLAAMSLSSPRAIINREVFIFPKEITLISYKTVFNDPKMVRSMFFTVILTVVSTSISMVMTTLLAYPLTRKRMTGRKLISTLVIFTMYFSGGMIPDYLLIKSLNLLDSFWVLVLPGCISVFNMIILKSFFFSIPQSLEESAYIDGANDTVILTRIFLPLSKSVLATLTLFYAVGRWNGFQDALMYVSDSKLHPIQLKLYQVVNNLTSIDIIQQEGTALTEGMKVPSEGMKAACVMFATIPILLIYPWLQKYFISGIMVGAIKG